jgi:hypothetical protein
LKCPLATIGARIKRAARRGENKHLSTEPGGCVTMPSCERDDVEYHRLPTVLVCDDARVGEFAVGYPSDALPPPRNQFGSQPEIPCGLVDRSP